MVSYAPARLRSALGALSSRRALALLCKGQHLQAYPGASEECDMNTLRGLCQPQQALRRSTLTHDDPRDRIPLGPPWPLGAQPSAESPPPSYPPAGQSAMPGLQSDCAQPLQPGRSPTLAQRRHEAGAGAEQGTRAGLSAALGLRQWLRHCGAEGQWRGAGSKAIPLPWLCVRPTVSKARGGPASTFSGLQPILRWRLSRFSPSGFSMAAPSAPPPLPVAGAAMTLPRLLSPCPAVQQPSPLARTGARGFAKRPKKWHGVPWRFARVEEGQPVPAAQPNEGSVQGRNRWRRYLQREAFKKVQNQQRKALVKAARQAKAAQHLHRRNATLARAVRRKRIAAMARID